MKRVMDRIVHLQKVHEQFTQIAQRHARRSEELYFVNQEQAEAEYLKCLAWVAKAESAYWKARGLSDKLTWWLRKKYNLEAA